MRKHSDNSSEYLDAGPARALLAQLGTTLSHTRFRQLDDQLQPLRLGAYRTYRRSAIETYAGRRAAERAERDRRRDARVADAQQRVREYRDGTRPWNAYLRSKGLKP